MYFVTHSAPVPTSLNEAVDALRVALGMRGQLHDLSHEAFIAAWGAIAYIAPGLHPDEAGHSEGGWPEGWRCIAEEAFRRHEQGAIEDGELYPYPCAQKALGLPWRPLGDGTLGC